ncbi:MAG: hypothetical protein HKN43_01280 [Rhodothermales bacterium]|nr:hypothetical protein [Rhodothermales bacterium]
MSTQTTSGDNGFIKGFSRVMNRISGDRDATWFYFNFQKMVRSPNVRKKLARIEASFKANSDPDLFTEEILDIAAELGRHGKTSPLSLISAEHVDEMYSYMAEKKWVDRQRKDIGEFALDGVPEDTQLAHLPLEDVLRAPHLLRLANDPSILLAIEKQFGCKPSAEVIQASWSPPSKKEAIRSQLFHRDTDGLQFIKLFIFLTDVTEDSGPHCFVLNSHDANKLTKPGFFTEEQVIDSFGEENITFISCPKGTHFLENTYGVHKGTQPKGHGRLMVQVLYCSHPTIYPPKKPVLSSDDLNALGVEDLDRYVFRKFVQ